MIAHIFVDDRGELSITPCTRITEEDEERLKAIWRHHLVTVDERLSAARGQW